jgi:hypothetical protein
VCIPAFNIQEQGLQIEGSQYGCELRIHFAIGTAFSRLESVMVQYHAETSIMDKGITAAAAGLERNRLSITTRSCRRTFLTAIFTANALQPWLQAAGSDMIVLQGDDIERLKLDFNLNQSRVRLVFMLSPT